MLFLLMLIWTAKQNKIAKEMEGAVKTDNDFQYKTAEDDQMFNYFEASMKADRMDDIAEEINMMKSMTEAEFKAEMEIDEDVEIDKDRLIESIEKRYKLAQKAMKQADNLAPYASEDVKSIIARDLYQFDRVVERRNKLQNQFDDIAGIGTFTDINTPLSNVYSKLGLDGIEGLLNTPNYKVGEDVSDFKEDDYQPIKEAFKDVNVADRKSLLRYIRILSS